MKLQDWHVIHNHITNARICLYGDIEDYITEEHVKLTDISEIPMEQWTIPEITEITGNILEDVNLHRYCSDPITICNLMYSVNIPETLIHNFALKYMQYIFDIYGY